MENRKLVFTKPNTAEVVSCAMPVIGPDEVLIETDYTVISAGTERDNITDSANVTGNWPRLLGYSGSGRIVAAGSQVTDFRAGDRVLTDHLGHCAFVKASFRPNADGFYKIPDGIDQIEAAFVVIGSMGVQGARKLMLQMGEAGMVRGLGILGLFAVQSMVCMGAVPLIAVSADPARRKVALELGADYAIAPDEDFVEHVRELTDGRMINAAVEVTGKSIALTECLGVAARGARISLTGCTRVSDVPIDFYSMVHKPGILLLGAHNHVRPTRDSSPGFWTRHDDFAAMMRMMKLGRMRAAPIISNVIGTDEAPKLYRELAEKGQIGLGNVIDWHK